MKEWEEEEQQEEAEQEYEQEQEQEQEQQEDEQEQEQNKASTTTATNACLRITREHRDAEVVQVVHIVLEESGVDAIKIQWAGS